MHTPVNGRPNISTSRWFAVVDSHELSTVYLGSDEAAARLLAGANGMALGEAVTVGEAERQASLEAGRMKRERRAGGDYVV